jgi:hypothetical protein
MARNLDTTYYLFEGKPTIYRPGYARSYIDGEWKVVDSAEVALYGAVLTEADFRKKFGRLPTLGDPSKI